MAKNQLSTNMTSLTFFPKFMRAVILHNDKIEIHASFQENGQLILLSCNFYNKTVARFTF